jgi:hypothetical protein
VGVVTLNAIQFYLVAVLLVPIAIDPAMNVLAPFPVMQAVALCTELGGLVPRDFHITEIGEGVTVFEMVTIQAEDIAAVVEDDVCVFTLKGLFTEVTFKAIMTHGTFIELPVPVQAEGTALAAYGGDVMDAIGGLFDFEGLECGYIVLRGLLAGQGGDEEEGEERPSPVPGHSVVQDHHQRSQLPCDVTHLCPVTVYAKIVVFA